MLLTIDNGVNYKYVSFLPVTNIKFEFPVDWNFSSKLFNSLKILDKISDYYYVSDFSEMLVENKDFFSCLCRTLFIIYTMQLRIHNKPTLEGLKKNNFSSNSTIQKKRYFFFLFGSGLWSKGGRSILFVSHWHISFTIRSGSRYTTITKTK